MRGAARCSLVVALGLLAMPPATPAASPKYDYITHCMGCHGADGTGVPGRIPALRETLPAFARSSAGRAFVVSVPGASSSSLTDAQLAAVLNWLLEQFVSAGAVATTPFSVAEVTAHRRPTLTNVGAARARAIATLDGSGPVPSLAY